MKPDIDPFFQDVPWEIIQDDKGRVLAEVFTLPDRLTWKGQRVNNNIFRTSVRSDKHARLNKYKGQQ